MRKSCIAAALLVVAAGAAVAQNRTTELQARSYIRSAFITGVAHAILSADVALGPRLRERLALPANALRVRESSAAEVAGIAARAAGRPVFALEGGAVPLILVYDLDRPPM